MKLDIDNLEIKYKIVDLEQRSPEWLAFRKGKIGASQIAAIIGIDPFRTRLQLWEDMIFERSIPITPQMQRGIDREQEALNWYNQGMGLFKPVVLQSLEYPWMIASLDGFHLTTPTCPEILEIKWPSRQTHQMAIDGHVPNYYYPQLQFQMYIAGAISATYLSCHDKDKVTIEVMRDDEYLKGILPKIHAFRASLIDLKPPEPTDRDRVEIVDSELSPDAERFCELDRLIGELMVEREELKEKLKGASDHPRFKIGPVSVSRYARDGGIDYKSIPILQRMDLTEYKKKPIECWRVTYE